MAYILTLLQASKSTKKPSAFTQPFDLPTALMPVNFDAYWPHAPVGILSVCPI